MKISEIIFVLGIAIFTNMLYNIIKEKEIKTLKNLEDNKMKKLTKAQITKIEKENTYMIHLLKTATTKYVHLSDDDYTGDVKEVAAVLMAKGYKNLEISYRTISVRVK